MCATVQLQAQQTADPSLGEDLLTPSITGKEMFMKAARTTHPAN